ncbi:MAG: DUF1634 domain-containing protein [Terriglobales bacterium]
MTQSETRAFTDQKLENMVGNLLRAGVSLSALVVLFGGIIYLARHGREPAGYNVFHGEPSDLKSLSGIVRYAFAFHGRPRRLIYLGFRRGARPDVYDLHWRRAGSPAVQPPRLRLRVLKGVFPRP